MATPANPEGDAPRDLYRCPACGEMVDNADLKAVIAHHQHVLAPLLFQFGPPRAGDGAAVAPPTLQKAAEKKTPRPKSPARARKKTAPALKPGRVLPPMFNHYDNQFLQQGEVYQRNDPLPDNFPVPTAAEEVINRGPAQTGDQSDGERSVD